MILLCRLQDQEKIIHGVEVKILDIFEEKGWITDWAGQEESFWRVGKR